ncbi:hypothetical protein [Mucilaginibacter sp. SP1R1]|uniref:hypothetical protein n=1 Tax=Mucilaginibacter sp. SP1R1 TaxID=2723091 RepID=UPI00160FD667|nr:hypothetical protein [Mucilaginibacter sp. SP1R1]MBB6149468.1 hypothetical protein [Mucilaginibacter sp. SP1R1]
MSKFDRLKNTADITLNSVFRETNHTGNKTLADIVKTAKLVELLRLEWEPQEDITTFELAQAIKIFLNGGTIMPDQFDNLSKSVSRHFKVIS